MCFGIVFLEILSPLFQEPIQRRKWYRERESGEVQYLQFLCKNHQQQSSMTIFVLHSVKPQEETRAVTKRRTSRKCHAVLQLFLKLWSRYRTIAVPDLNSKTLEHTVIKKLRNTE